VSGGSFVEERGRRGEGIEWCNASLQLCSLGLEFLKRDFLRNLLCGREIEFEEVGHCRSRYLIEGESRESLSKLNRVIGCCILVVRDGSSCFGGTDFME
jgi:hypothetical protein